MLLKLLHKIERECFQAPSFFTDHNCMIPKPDKNTFKQENYGQIALMNMGIKVLNKMFEN